MAKLQEDVLTIKISKLIKDSDEVGTNLTPELVQSVEAVVQELAGAGTLVEISLD